MMKVPAYLLATTVALAFAGGALGHDEPKQGAKPKPAISKDVHPWGREGDPRQAVRTIAVDMSDAMRFTPSQITVKKGDTVKFVVTNSGKQLHEMVIGTEQDLAKHAELMRKHPGMEHEEPYMAHVQPGAKGSIAWTFTHPGTFMYGCLVPGHWEAGMKGKIVVTAK